MIMHHFNYKGLILTDIFNIALFGREEVTFTYIGLTWHFKTVLGAKRKATKLLNAFPQN